MYKAAIIAALGLASVSAVKAESYGELLVGFTTKSGSDVIYDLGALSSITSGQTWDAGTLGISAASSASYSWGVIGDDYAANGTVVNNTLWTTANAQPGLINGGSKFNAIDSSIASLYAPILANGVSGYTVAATSANSWNNQAIAGALTTQYHNAYVNPTTTGLASISLFQVTDDNTAPVNVGSFSLDNTGLLTFTANSGSVAVPEPTSIAAFGGAGLLLLSLRNRFRSNKA